MSEISDLEEELVKAAAESDSRNHLEKLNCEEEDSGNYNKKFKKNNEEATRIVTYEENNHTEQTNEVDNGYANIVATHYNQLEEKGREERSKSRIVHLRNFHNWIKSMLINEYLSKIKESKRYNAPLCVHDMCCGKGGDLLKWRKGNITHLICSDIAAVSLEQCKARYNDMVNRSRRDRGSQKIYTIEYIAADCTRTRLREKYSDPSMKLDLVSCQFSFHYCFESLPQAECMLRNASECLRPGGFFIGTIPDAYDLMARAQKTESDIYGNSVYKVVLDFDHNSKPDLFGAKYNFYLDGVVNCPEFLVHFPTLEKLAKKFGLKLVRKEKFYDYYERMKKEGQQLLLNMRSLEAYPPTDNSFLSGTEPDDYLHASKFIEERENKNMKIGTLSKSEWEASCKYYLYIYRTSCIVIL